MTESRQIGIQDLEKLLQEDDKIIEIHPDGTVTVEGVVGPPKPLLTYKTPGLGDTY